MYVGPALNWISNALFNNNWVFLIYIHALTRDISNGILPYYNESTEYGLKDRKHKSQCSRFADVGRKG